MTTETLCWLMECAVRSSAMALVAGVFLLLFRVKDAAVRSAVWTGVLVAAVLMPLCSAMFPPVFVYPPAAVTASYVEFQLPLPSQDAQQLSSPSIVVSKSGWMGSIYLAVAFALVLRLAIGLGMGIRMRQSSSLIEGFERSV